MRDATVQIRLKPEMRDKLSAYADRLGVPMSSLGAFVIGNFLDQQERVMGPTIQKMVESITKAMVDEMKGQEAILEEHLGQFVESFTASVQASKIRKGGH